MDAADVASKFLPLADWWADKIQWTEEDHNDLVQEGMLELIKTLRGYQRSGREIRNLQWLASTCFSGAMKWWYKDIDREQMKVEGVMTPLRHTTLDGICLPVEGEAEYLGEIWLREYIEEAYRVLGHQAGDVVAQLLLPSMEAAQIAVFSEMEAEVRKAKGERVLGWKRIHKRHIRHACGLTETQWDQLLRRIKVFTLEFLERTDAGVLAALRRSPACYKSPTLAFMTRC